MPLQALERSLINLFGFNLTRYKCGIDAQVICGYARAGEPPCAASVCQENLAAHYEEAHQGSKTRSVRPVTTRTLFDGSRSATKALTYSFRKNDGGWFENSAGLAPYVFKTAIGGCYALDLQNVGGKEMRFGVRQLGRGPPRHRLASVKVSFGSADGTCVQYHLSRVLAADERLGDAALCAGTPPAVVRVDPAFLAPTLVLDASDPRLERPWDLKVATTLVFEVMKVARAS